MNGKCLSFILVCVFLWAVPCRVQAQNPEKKGDPVVRVTLSDGANVGFVLVRSHQTSRDNAISEVVINRSNSVARVLYDKKKGTYFGYRLEVKSVKKNQYRLEFKSLSQEMEAEMRRRMQCATCPAPILLAGSRFPDPMVVNEDKFCSIDLMVNTQTGEKIVDILQVSSQPISTEKMQAESGKTREVLLYIERGSNYVTRGKLVAAIEEYRKAIDITPNDAVTQNKLGVCYHRLGQIDMAQVQFEIALKINPKYADAWNNLAICLQLKGKYKQAVQHYTKAIEYKPAFSVAYRNMSAAMFAQNQFEAGYRALQNAFRLDPAIVDQTASPSIFGPNANAAQFFYYFAKVSAANKLNDKALDFLARAVAYGLKDCSLIAQDPDLRPLMELPRFKQILQLACP
jgi:Tfp pilus assembly protein PilF